MGGGAGTDAFAAVLVASDGAGGLRELGRVALPGMPILGEGKPENQNLGLTFTRGAKLMVVDMNQDGYFEEALKVRYPTPCPYPYPCPYPSPSPSPNPNPNPTPNPNPDPTPNPNPDPKPDPNPNPNPKP